MLTPKEIRKCLNKLSVLKLAETELNENIPLISHGQKTVQEAVNICLYSHELSQR